MKFNHLLLLPWLSLVYSVQAQYCGTVLNSNHDLNLSKLATFKSNYHPEKSKEVDSIAITFHVVETIKGAPNIDFSNVLEELDIINQIYSRSGLYFFSCGSERYISGDYSYNFLTGDALNKRNYEPNTINIYYASELVDNNGGLLCGYAIFPWAASIENRYIMMTKSCSDNGATLAHELGHYFGLLHTHETIHGSEFSSGLNCISAGDLICDTPADPTLGFNNVSGCTYIGRELDPIGDPYSPSPSNIMSYAPSQCRRLLTEEQQSVVKFYYESEFSSLFNSCNFYPDFAIISSTTPYISRSGETISLDYSIYLKGIQDDYDITVFFWLSDNPEIKGQIFQRDTIEILTGNSLQLHNFQVGIPLNKSSNKYYLTAEIDADKKVLERSERNNLNVLNLEIDNSLYEDIVLFPNPATDYIRVFLRESKLSQDVTINIWDRSGRLKKTKTGYKKNEEFFVEITVSELPQDLYICELFFERKEISKSFLFYKL